jgi:hypothetical protein
VKGSFTPTGWSFVSCAAMMMRQVSIRFVFEIEFLREHLFYRTRSMFILRITVLGCLVSLQPSTPIDPILLKALRICRGMFILKPTDFAVLAEILAPVLFGELLSCLWLLLFQGAMHIAWWYVDVSLVFPGSQIA